MLKKNLSIVYFLFISLYVQSQESNFAKFKQLSCPEKIWVVQHPFVARKAFNISLEARNLSEKFEKDTLLDGDGWGGQVDAFRHVYWMASLNREIHWRKAKRLGDAHEKGNYKEYKKGVSKSIDLPDEKTCEMDFLNNDIGLQLGFDYPDIDKDSLINIVLNEVIVGKMWIIKKDKQGDFLDCDGNILKPEDYKGLWYNNKCLVPSNFVRP